jgi:hypothetical protein
MIQRFPYKLSRLRQSARKSATTKGHHLGRFTRDAPLSTTAHAQCTVCGMHVIINAHPMPNEIDIGGMAVAMTCTEAAAVNAKAAAMKKSEDAS